MVKIALSEMKAKCQTVWIRMAPDVLSGLIWIQTVCKIGNNISRRQYIKHITIFFCLNSVIMNKLYHTETIYLLVPLFHVSFRERLAPGHAFLSPNTKFASKGFQSCPGKIVFLAVQKCGTPRNKPTHTCHRRSACLNKWPN